MSNLHRLTWVDTQIRNNTFPNCRIIAERFEISTRQAARDIEYLRDTMGAPLCFDARRNGYYYSEPTFVLPGVMLSEQEQQTLSFLAHRYQQSNSDQARQLAELFSRLGAGANHFRSAGMAPPVPVPKLKGVEVEVFQVLNEAIAELRQVEIVYSDAKGETTRRSLQPYKLFFKFENAYVVGYCLLRGSLRVFALSRFREIRKMNVKFTVPASFHPEEYGENMCFNLRESYQALVRFHGPFQTEPWKLRVVPEGESVYRFEFTRSADLLSFLLGQPSEFTILAPEWLKSKLKARVTGILERNKES